MIYRCASRMGCGLKSAKDQGRTRFVVGNVHLVFSSVSTYLLHTLSDSDVSMDRVNPKFFTLATMTLKHVEHSK